MRPTSSLIPLLLVLGSCGSPPKPPTVDESFKRPANSAMAVDPLRQTSCRLPFHADHPRRSDPTCKKFNIHQSS